MYRTTLDFILNHDWSTIIAAIIAVVGVVYTVKDNHVLKVKELKLSTNVKIIESRSTLIIDDIRQHKTARNRVLPAMYDFVEDRHPESGSEQNFITLEKVNSTVREWDSMVVIGNDGDEYIQNCMHEAANLLLNLNSSSDDCIAAITNFKISIDSRIESMENDIVNLEAKANDL